MHANVASQMALGLTVIAGLAGSASAAAASATGVPATNYQQYGTAGACGQVTANNALGVALNMNLFDSGDYCGKTVQITKDDGSTFTAPVVDRCGPGGTCSNQGGIDTTNQLFSTLGGNIAGVGLDLDSTVGYGHVTVSFEILNDDSASAGGGVASAVGGAVQGVTGGGWRHKRTARGSKRNH